MAKNTYGTGCFLLMNTGHEAVASTHSLVTTVAWQLQKSGVRGEFRGSGVRDDFLQTGGGAPFPAGGETDVNVELATSRTSSRCEYALEGSVFIGGAAVQWLRDGLKIVRSASEIEALAASVADNGGVYFVPAFAGLGAPHWDAYARGAMFGLTRGSTSAHIARAALEAIAYQSADVLRAMQQDAGITLTELRVDGGATANNLLMQFQADILGVPVVRPRVAETTALGAAYLAGLAVGFWKDSAEVAANWQVDRRFDPSMPRERVDELVDGWNRAIARVKST
jgi:glycerol kinase